MKYDLKYVFELFEHFELCPNKYLDLTLFAGPLVPTEAATIVFQDSVSVVKRCKAKKNGLSRVNGLSSRGD
jgi:hypothetical protein